MRKYTVIGISRGNEYSPNHVDNDAAIFRKVADTLIALGCIVHLYTEKEFLNEPVTGDIIFHMARDKKTLALLREMEDSGAIIVNSAYGIENCIRKPMTALLLENHIPHPESYMGNVDDIDQTNIRFYPCWVKRGDSHALVKEDVCYATSWEEVKNILNDFRTRNIPTAVINRHLEGDLIKFYGVQGQGYYYWFYPSPCSHSKFGLEKINGEAKGISFEVEAMKKWCEKAAEVLKVSVYGGDCVVTEDGKISIIDFNDWPSFARCREEAGEQIAAYIYNRVQN